MILHTSELYITWYSSMPYMILKLKQVVCVFYKKKKRWWFFRGAAHEMGASSCYNPLDVESQQLVLDVPEGTKVILNRKEKGARSQLWRMTGEGQLQHEGSSPPRDPRSKHSAYCDDRIWVCHKCYRLDHLQQIFLQVLVWRKAVYIKCMCEIR
jgi:hypothetical protein